MSVPIVPIFELDDPQQPLRQAADLLRRGRLVVLPTETVYGAAGVLTHADALARLRALRPGPADKPFVVHLAGPEQARRFLGDVGELGGRMMRKLWPGPVGLMFDVPAEKRREVAAQLGAAENNLYDGVSITLRCPDHAVTQAIIAQVDAPVVLSRAGQADDPFALDLHEIAETLDGQIDLIIDAGPSRFSKASTLIRVGTDDYRIVREGIYDQRIIDRLLRTTILFVCSGNTCRSPMAEAIARKLLADQLNLPQEKLEEKGIAVMSAGCMAMTGARATAAAAEAVKPLGADLSHHRSRPLTVELIHQADWIFAMGRSHAEIVTALVPSAAHRITTLDPAGDIDDPIGGDQTLYHQLADRIRQLLEQRLPEVLK